MTTAALPIAVLLGLEASADAHLRTLRQAVHVAQEACPHPENDELPPVDFADTTHLQCRACRKIR